MGNVGIVGNVMAAHRRAIIDFREHFAVGRKDASWSVDAVDIPLFPHIPRCPGGHRGNLGRSRSVCSVDNPHNPHIPHCTRSPTLGKRWVGSNAEMSCSGSMTVVSGYRRVLPPAKTHTGERGQRTSRVKNSSKRALDRKDFAKTRDQV